MRMRWYDWLALWLLLFASALVGGYWLQEHTAARVRRECAAVVRPYAEAAAQGRMDPERAIIEAYNRLEMAAEEKP